MAELKGAIALLPDRDLANRQLDSARSFQAGVVWQPF